MTNAEKAKTYAEEKHAGQVHGTRPFMMHLTEVVNTLHEFGYLDDDLTAAAWLHDVVEDTNVTTATTAELKKECVYLLVYEKESAGLHSGTSSSAPREKSQRSDGRSEVRKGSSMATNPTRGRKRR